MPFFMYNCNYDCIHEITLFSDGHVTWTMLPEESSHFNMFSINNYGNFSKINVDILCEQINIL